MDLFLFVAEHDDHHLARITELINLTTSLFQNEALTPLKLKNQYRVKFDFEISFTNGGNLKGTEFRLDLNGDDITDEDLATYIVQDLRLLMVAETKILNKEIINEHHKRT